MGRLHQTGIDGEAACSVQLERFGWRVVQLNASKRNYPNSDLMAEKRGARRLIQVKTSAKTKGYITGGGVTPKIVAGDKIFNRVPTAEYCDYIIFLAAGGNGWRYFVVPVFSAEAIFRKNIDAYFGGAFG